MRLRPPPEWALLSTMIIVAMFFAINGYWSGERDTKHRIEQMERMVDYSRNLGHMEGLLDAAERLKDTLITAPKMCNNCRVEVASFMAYTRGYVDSANEMIKSHKEHTEKEGRSCREQSRLKSKTDTIPSTSTE